MSRVMAPHDPRPRVLMVGPWPPTKGGVTTFMLNVVRSRLKERYEFIPFTTSRPAKRNVSEDNYGYAAIFKGGMKRVLKGIGITLWHLLSFPWIVAIGRPAVIQIQASDFQAFWEASLYAVMGNLLRRPVALRIGGSFDRFYETSGALARALIRWVLRRPALLMVQSEYWKNYIGRLVNSPNVTIVPNFVPGSLLKPRVLRADNPRFMLCSGEVPQLKGAYVALAAIQLLREQGIMPQLSIMAVTPALRDRIVERGLDSIVTMLDFLSHEEALEEMRRTEVFLQISSSEGFPNALLEAMASGCAAIVTPVGAVPEMVGKDGECAFVVPAGDAAQLAERMRLLIQDHEGLVRMGAAAQKRIRAAFTEDTVISVLDQAWQCAIEQRGTLPGTPRQRPI
jgi:glycosyltransferase involved in cell wall biosynthesis